jgi:uracil-DNA glycosylase
MNEKILLSLQGKMIACRLCITEGFSIEPGAVFSGNAEAEVMLIGQAPGITEVTAKRPFNAGSGQRLFQWLSRAEFIESAFRQDQYMTAVTKCYPGKNRSGKGDRVPSRREQNLCRAFLNKELHLVNPRLIIPVGSLAIQLFFNKALKLSDVIGRAAFWEDESGDEWPHFSSDGSMLLTSLPKKWPSNGRWIVPLPHPSGASLWPNRPENQQLIDQAIGLLNEIRNKLNIQGSLAE